mmetsp:Transcript_22736/g.49795  ORF Transcript_22736/g.49795 Transcript_22736/m.49795 type:complete len:249 (+) Transcript_22736:925-1671(+)
MRPSTRTCPTTTGTLSTPPTRSTAASSWRRTLWPPATCRMTPPMSTSPRRHLVQHWRARGSAGSTSLHSSGASATTSPSTVEARGRRFTTTSCRATCPASLTPIITSSGGSFTGGQRFALFLMAMAGATVSPPPSWPPASQSSSRTTCTSPLTTCCPTWSSPYGCGWRTSPPCWTSCRPSARSRYSSTGRACTSGGMRSAGSQNKAARRTTTRSRACTRSYTTCGACTTGVHALWQGAGAPLGCYGRW